MAALILPAALLAWTWAYRGRTPWRLAFLQALITFGAMTVVITEALSPLAAIDRTPVLVCWCLVGAASLLLRLRPPIPDGKVSRPPWFVLACIAVIAGMAALVAATAILSPPNSADAMSYHLPRVVYWMQHHSVAFFPTQYLGQIMLQPVTEYVMLHAHLLAGSDRFTNLVQFAAYVGSIVGVSSAARELELSPRAQAMAALFCATLPNVILQASGAKNDLVLALWLVCVILFAIRWACSRSTQDLIFLALSTGLALGTKGTAYLFVPPALAAGVLAAGLRLPWRRWAVAVAAIAAGVLLINAPQYARNYDLSGSVMGFDSAQGDGFFRWRNEPFGWKPTVSNLLRNTSEQLGARSEQWNQWVFDAVVSLHHRLGIDPQDAGTTWRWTEFRPPRNSNHEADANNRWHLLIIAMAVWIAIYTAIVGRERRWLYYCIGPVGGFLAFCFYLKWQPFFSRLEAPLFVLSAPLAAMALHRFRATVVHVGLCLLLVSNSRLALLQNWTRPLKGASNIRNTPRQQLYFNDMSQWNNRESYLAAVDAVAASGCARVGVDITLNHVEYPFQILLRQRNPVVRFRHAGVGNASGKYAFPHEETPCAVLCLDCAGVEPKEKEYQPVGEIHRIGRFLLVIAPAAEGHSVTVR